MISTRFNNKKTYEFLFTTSIENLIKAAQILRENKETASFSYALMDALHEKICSERLTKEEVMQILQVATEFKLKFLRQDAESRLRNLSAN